MECIIASNTGAEVTVVSGHLVYEKQMLDDWVKVKGATGAPVTLQLAEVPFVFEDREFVEEGAVFRIPKQALAWGRRQLSPRYCTSKLFNPPGGITSDPVQNDKEASSPKLEPISK